jgi:hypothetical protein
MGRFDMSKKKSRLGELRRRWQALLEDGTLARLRSEGRLVALYVFHRADWGRCDITFSIRQAAATMGVKPTAVQRGVRQMLDEGVLAVRERGQGNGKTRFEVVERTQAVCAAHTSRVRARTQAVDGAHTSGVQSAHEPCTERTQPVYTAHTPCGRYSVIPSGISVNTTVGQSADATTVSGPVASPPPRGSKEAS